MQENTAAERTRFASWRGGGVVETVETAGSVEEHPGTDFRCMKTIFHSIPRVVFVPTRSRAGVGRARWVWREGKVEAPALENMVCSV